jgi:pyruvate-formate lyase-activating enzyme
VGCISFQEGDVKPNQERMRFSPTAAEVAEVTEMHFGRVKNPIASFGQGCEGEPLTQARVLIDSVKLIREKHEVGTVNLNTNASIPDAVEELCSVGLSSIRASLASPTPELYDRYHRPGGYTIADVIDSIRRTKKAGRFVSLNLLVFPGLTDRIDEMEALEAFIADHGIDMIQWRNMNMDPESYLDVMGRGESGEGLYACVARLRERFPELRHGYFNPFLG